MKKMGLSILAVVLLLLAMLACSLSPATTPTPDVQATIDAGIQATAAAQANLQATIDASVQATAVSMPPTPTSGAPVEYVTMSEEELEALIEKSVQEAVTATQQAASSSSQAASDAAVTSQEVEEMYAYYYAAEQAVALAEEYIEAYYGLYYDLAVETVALLEDLEQDLSTMTDSLNSIYTSLELINDSLQQGVAIAEETITQLNNAAQSAQAQLEQVQTKTQQWASAVTEERDKRAQAVASIQPQNVPTDRLSALSSAFGFLDSVKGALGDDKLSLEELSTIAQFGASAQAGLNAHGGDQLKSLSGMICQITTQLARGQLPQARQGLGQFEMSLGQRPPNLPSFSPGNLPGGGLPGIKRP